jgi:acetyl esterase/lipase
MKFPRLWLALFALFAAPTVLFAQAEQRPRMPVPTEKQIYKTVGDTKLEIWIWKPADWKATDHRTGIVFYHGGGWRNGTPASFAFQSQKLADLGMVAFSVQYRLTSQPGVTIEDCVKDARSAFRWVRAHAVELGLDPEKIAAGGGSAGGQLAAALATLEECNDSSDDLKVSTQPAALVLFNPALMLDSGRAARISGEKAEAAKRLSPFSHLGKGHPPTLIQHGEQDTTVPIGTARQYADRVKELGGDCEVVGYEGQVHSFFNRPPFLQQTFDRMAAFLEAQKLLGPRKD